MPFSQLALPASYCFCTHSPLLVPGFMLPFPTAGLRSLRQADGQKGTLTAHTFHPLGHGAECHQHTCVLLKLRLSGKFRKCGGGDETVRLNQPLTPVSQNMYLPKANILSHILTLTAASPLPSGATTGEKEASLFSLPQCSLSAQAWLDFILASTPLPEQADLPARCRLVTTCNTRALR